LFSAGHPPISAEAFGALPSFAVGIELLLKIAAMQVVLDRGNARE